MFAASLILLLALQVNAENSTTQNSTHHAYIDHGANMLCTPTNWFDVCVFFLGNYISHALTIKAYPGEATTSVLIAALGALLIPSTGLIRGVNAIARNAKFKRKGFFSALFRDPDYQTAAAGGALCMVVRKKSWKPYPGDKLSNVMLRDEGRLKTYGKWTEMGRRLGMRLGAPVWFELEPIARENDAPEPLRMLKVYRGPWSEEQGRYWIYTDTRQQYVHPSKTVQGLCDFKDQSWSYALAHVPRDALLAVNRGSEVTPRRLESSGIGISEKTTSTAVEAVESISGREKPDIPIIAASYSIPKAVIAMVQLGYATVTLYQSGGGQIEHYGYAAFALTVIPYAIMSLINLIGNLLTPDYQALYLVSNEVMDEAIQRGCQFDGVVGRLVEDDDHKSASIEVLPDEFGQKSGVEFAYKDKMMEKKLAVSVVDYSSPPLPCQQRRRYVKDKRNATAMDLSASVFIPSCSRFRRLDPHSYPTETSRYQLTPQGSFSFTTPGKVDWRMVICFLNAGLILAILGGVTQFRVGTASIGQLNWILHWYLFGAVYSGFSIWDGLERRPWPEPDMPAASKHDVWWMIVPLILYGIPAIGGFVAVIDMLYDWGTCTFY